MIYYFNAVLIYSQPRTSLRQTEFHRSQNGFVSLIVVVSKYCRVAVFISETEFVHRRARRISKRHAYRRELFKVYFYLQELLSFRFFRIFVVDLYPGYAVDVRRNICFVKIVRTVRCDFVFHIG